MDDNREQQLKEKIKLGQKTVSSLLEEYGSLLLKQMQIETTGDSDRIVEQAPIVDDANKQLMDFDLVMESIQQQIKLAREKYVHDQPAVHTSVICSTSDECSTIQSDHSQKEVNNELSNKQVKLSDDNIGQIEAKSNPTVPEPQALFTGTLPDDFYLLLISVMGIQECLISNRRVCSFWNELVLERCNNQKSLKLFETFDTLMEFSELLLKFEKLNDTSLILQSIGDDLVFEVLETDHEQLVDSLQDDGESDFEEEEDGEEDENGVIQKEVLTREKKLGASKVLTSIFPRIEQLVLCPEKYTFIDIEHVLKFYAKQLTTLTMTNILNGNHFISKLSFPLLKSLNIFNFSLEDDQLLSLLPQLESLSLSTTEIRLETLLRTGTQLQELNIADIANVKSVYSSPVDQFSKRPPINSNLRKFSFDIKENESQALEFISLSLTSIQSLKLSFRKKYPNFKFNSLIPYLVPLQQLNSLTLHASVSFFVLNENLLSQIQPLSSVRYLKILLMDYGSLSVDLFSRSLFAAFPNVEQVLIAFKANEDDGRVATGTFAKFEDFAGKHPNVVQLFRSKDMFKFTNLPNVVAPLLGHRRQMYEEYIEFEELFGVPLCKLVASLDKQEGEDGPNLKITLRPADRLTAMSNYFELLESDAFTFTFEKVDTMIGHMVKCALKYGPSEGALFSVTCKCVLILLDSNVVEEYYSHYETWFLNAVEESEDLEVYHFLKLMMELVQHYVTQKFNDNVWLFQICKRIVLLMKEFNFICFSYDDEFVRYENEPNAYKNGIKIFEILLELADHYKRQQLNVLDNDEKLLLQIHGLMNDQLKKFHQHDLLGKAISRLISLYIREYRIEVARALLRFCQSTDD